MKGRGWQSEVLARNLGFGVADYMHLTEGTPVVGSYAKEDGFHPEHGASTMAALRMFNAVCNNGVDEEENLYTVNEAPPKDREHIKFKDDSFVKTESFSDNVKIRYTEPVWTKAMGAESGPYNVVDEESSAFDIFSS